MKEQLSFVFRLLTLNSSEALQAVPFCIACLLDSSPLLRPLRT